MMSLGVFLKQTQTRSRQYEWKELKENLNFRNSLTLKQSINS